MFEFSKSNAPNKQDLVDVDYRSLVFKSLSDMMKRRSGKMNILDFGKPNDKNIQFFNQFSCKLYIADLNSDWQMTQSKLPWYLSWTSLFSDESLLDVIICWDLLNYMDEVQLQSWYQSIKKYAAKRTLLQALFSTGPNMPVSPGHYQILNDHRIRVRFEKGERGCPRYTQIQIQKLMPGLVVQRSFLLQNGMQEYLFEFKDDEWGSS